MERSLDFDLPPYQDVSFAWYGPQLQKHSEEWAIHLSFDELNELKDAMRPLSESGMDIALITSENFVLPGLGPRLGEVRQSLIRGKGVVLLHGLDIGRFSKREAAITFFGVGAYIGKARSQNAEGHLLGHVKDVGRSGDDVNARIYQTHERQSFHTDSSDVVGLMCLKQARSGGESLLVSAATIFNEMRKRRPDLAALLFEPIATDRRGEVPEGMKPYVLIPVFSWYEGHLFVFYQRQYIESAQRFPEVPRLTDRHVEALELFDELANDPALNISMRLVPGDMQFVYNHSLLHDRTAFEDWEDPAEQRHLFRLWLTIPGDRPLPPCFAQRFGSIEIGNRGGIIAPVTKSCAPLDAD